MSVSHELATTVMSRCDALAALSEEVGRLTRPSYTPALRAAHDLVSGWMADAGMAVYEDAAGNLVGAYPAERSVARTLIIGSHLDTVRDAGRYDGILGVLTGIAAVEALHLQDRRLPFAIEVVAFADEEGLRFGTSFLGSLALCGRFTPDLLSLHDERGVWLSEAITHFGGDPNQIANDARRPADILAYIEVHIEQGPLLEARGLPLGVVSAITGSSRLEVTLTGTAGHAGTVPMGLRRDALCAAAELILATEAVARATPGLVATVGQIAARPGASNVIPGAVTLSLDVRHQDDQIRHAALAELRARAAATTEVRAVTVAWEEIQSRSAVPMAPALRERLARAIAAAGHTPIELPSGAGHDAAIMAEFTDAAMLFVRCAGGVSHNPGEAVDQADVATAIAALGHFLNEMAYDESHKDPTTTV